MQKLKNLTVRRTFTIQHTGQQSGTELCEIPYKKGLNTINPI